MASFETGVSDQAFAICGYDNGQPITVAQDYINRQRQRIAMMTEELDSYEQWYKKAAKTRLAMYQPHMQMFNSVMPLNYAVRPPPAYHSPVPTLFASPNIQPEIVQNQPQLIGEAEYIVNGKCDIEVQNDHVLYKVRTDSDNGDNSRNDSEIQRPAGYNKKKFGKVSANIVSKNDRMSFGKKFLHSNLKQQIEEYVMSLEAPADAGKNWRLNKCRRMLKAAKFNGGFVPPIDLDDDEDCSYYSETVPANDPIKDNAGENAASDEIVKDVVEEPNNIETGGCSQDTVSNPI